VKAGAGGRFLIGALLLALALLPAFVQAQSPATKIGYVDMKRLLDNAPQMLQSRAKLEHEFAPRDAALKADEARQDGLKKRYDRDAAIMAKPDAEALKREIDTLDRSIKRTREDLNKELNTRMAAERDRDWQQINDALIEYARAQGFELVVPSPVIYASPRVDITDAVLEQLKRAPPAPSGATP
jgi:outer membrane protein